MYEYLQIKPIYYSYKPVFNIRASDCAQMIAIATIEDKYRRDANNFEIRNPYALSSMLAKYSEDMKTVKNKSILH